MEYNSQNQCYNNMPIPKVMKSLTEFPFYVTNKHQKSLEQQEPER